MLTGTLAAGRAEVVEEIFAKLVKVRAWIWVNTTNEE
jgi:hypothetical protein